MDTPKITIVNYISLGKRIRQYRKEKHLTQQSLSEKCDITSTNLSHIERGATKPSLDILVKIANALEVNIDSLLCDSLTGDIAPIFKNKISELLDDCTDQEIRIISDYVEATKEIVRKYYKD